MTDEEDLTPDEYVIEELIDRRVVKGKRSYLAKYLGFPRNQAEWTSRTELATRCEDLMDEYDALHPISKKGKRAALRETIDSTTESEDSTPMPKPDPSRDSTTPTGKAPQVPTDEDCEGYLHLFAHCALKTMNEAVVEGMGSMWDASADAVRHPTFQESLEEAVIAWSAPQPFHPEAVPFVNRSLTHLYGTSNWSSHLAPRQQAGVRPGRPGHQLHL